MNLVTFLVYTVDIDRSLTSLDLIFKAAVPSKSSIFSDREIECSYAADGGLVVNKMRIDFVEKEFDGATGRELPSCRPEFHFKVGFNRLRVDGYDLCLVRLSIGLPTRWIDTGNCFFCIKILSG